MAVSQALIPLTGFFVDTILHHDSGTFLETIFPLTERRLWSVPVPTLPFPLKHTTALWNIARNCRCNTNTRKRPMPTMSDHSHYYSHTYTLPPRWTYHVILQWLGVTSWLLPSISLRAYHMPTYITQLPLSQSVCCKWRVRTFVCFIPWPRLFDFPALNSIRHNNVAFVALQRVCWGTTTPIVVHMEGWLE